MHLRSSLFRLLVRLLYLFVLLVPLSAAAVQVTGPSTSVPPYLDTHLPGVTVESILTVDDGTVPKTGGSSTTRLAGLPDGIGVIDGNELTPAEPDYFYLLVDHEINAADGVVRDHGSKGAFVSKWKVSKATHQVVEGDDLIKLVFEWNEGTGTYAPATFTFDRFCSADRPDPTALYNSGSGLGSREILFMDGEETPGGRAFAHVVTGPDAGNSYHLAHLGYLNFENVLLNPVEQDKTVAVMLDDAENGEVYVYVGDKQSAGTEVQKAGLVGGDLYAIAVVGKPYELDNDLALAVGESEPFTLKLLGTSGNRPTNGVETKARGAETANPVQPGQNFESLKMGGPEDGAWNADNPNLFYFHTKGTTSNGINAPTRLWRLEFSDISNPAAGGTLTRLLDGPELRLGSMDNMDYAVVAGRSTLLEQEDLGGDPRLGKVYSYDIDTGLLEEIAQHDPAVFFEGGASFLTDNEESSGIVDLQHVLGPGWFASSIQVHTANGLSDGTEQVEHGQLLLLNVDGRGTDTIREKVVANGDAWDYRVDGVDPGSDWNQPGFAIDGNWNVDAGGVPTGPAHTMLGYGETPGTFVSDLVQPPTPRAATYYFRHELDLADPDGVVLFDLYMKVDDGAVVYINGVEVARYNMNLDLTVGNNTFASRNEPAERDWKHIPVTGADVTLQPTGNVIAVSLHQENDSSSDLRMDLELIAHSKSPDPGNAPATPANLAAGNATETSIDLTWDPQADAKYFRIERQSPGDVAWAVIEDEYPGSFDSYTDMDVDPGTTYNYRMWAVNIHGRSALTPTASATTLVSLVPVIFSEDFEVPDSLGQFTAVDVAEPNAAWSWVLWDFGSTGAAQGNNFGAGNGPTEDWLITTDPVNFLFSRNETLEYDSQISFSGPAPQVLYSTDYDPTIHSDPNDATWTLINEDTSAFGTLTPVGPFDLSDIDGQARIAFKYTGDGGAGGQSVRFTIDDVLVKGDCGYDFEGGENLPIEDDAGSPWTVVNESSAFGWLYDTYDGRQGAVNNNFGSPAGGHTGGVEADDWLISPPIFTSGPFTGIDFDYYENFGDTLSKPLEVLVTNNYTGDPTTTMWTDITPSGLNDSTADAWIPVSSQFFGLVGSDVRVAFHYLSSGNGGGTTKRIGIDNVCISHPAGPLEADFSFTRSGSIVSFVPTVTGGVPPYHLEWDFGDGTTAGEDSPTHEYLDAGLYTVVLAVTDDEGTEMGVTKTDLIQVTAFMVPEKVGDLRIATFNTSMNRSSAGGLAADLASGTDPQIKQVAEVIQRADPDIILLNELDQVYDANGDFDWMATEQEIEDFKANYLEVAQANDTNPAIFPYHFVAPVNTGVPSGFDFNNDGDTTDPEDAYGFGDFPGQFALVVLSKHPIKDNQVRTFQHFLWKDMPGALLPPDPADTDGDGDTSSYYNEEELEVFRLSSKSHWDVPIRVPGVGLVHVLVSHPTPPVFDDGTADEYPDPDVADWNGLRNHDEVRFWADYITPGAGEYIYDDDEWAKAGDRTPRKPKGGLKRDLRFVILGDENADPVDGDATFNPINLLLTNVLIDTSITPDSDGALEQVPAGFTNPETKTASFNLRADYVLPSIAGWNYQKGWVFWSLTTDLEADLLSASDHRMVVVDLEGTH